LHVGELRAEVGDHPAFGRGFVFGFPGGDAVQGQAVEKRGLAWFDRQFDPAAGGEDLRRAAW
jgi:hypothetical protein